MSRISLAVLLRAAICMFYLKNAHSGIFTIWSKLSFRTQVVQLGVNVGKCGML
jgi:hypothetical protein